MSEEESWQRAFDQMRKARDVCLARAEKAEAENERLRAMLETVKGSLDFESRKIAETLRTTTSAALAAGREAMEHHQAQDPYAERHQNDLPEETPDRSVDRLRQCLIKAFLRRRLRARNSPRCATPPSS